jgi:hypothetical protein
MARPISVFKKETVDGILEDIKKGVPYQIAAEKHGVHEATFRWWRNKGKASIDAGIEDDYSKLLRSLRKIESNRISLNLNSIRKSKKGHKGKEWELQRSFWRYFSDKASELELNERVEKLENKKVEEDDESKKEVDKENGN